MSCLRSFLENNWPDLFKARLLSGEDGKKLRVMVDAESCLDRFYGGAHRDWLCGGQWSQMSGHLRRIKKKCEDVDVSLSFFFRGLQDQAGGERWMLAQKRNNARAVELFHKLIEKSDAQMLSTRMNGLYVDPAGLRTFFRLALMSLNFPVVQSFEDYERDFVDYTTYYRIDGILSNDMALSVGAAKSIGRFLLKDSWIHIQECEGLPVVEFSWDECAAKLGLSLPRMSILVTLLNDSSVRSELAKSHEELGRSGQRQGARASSSSNRPRDQVFRRALSTVRNLPANRLTPDHIAYDVFCRLSMTQSRVLAGDLRRAAETHHRRNEERSRSGEAILDDCDIQRDQNDEINSWQNLRTFLSDRVDPSLKRDTFSFSSRLAEPIHSSSLLRHVAASHRRGVVSPLLLQLASTGKVWLDSSLIDRSSSGVPDADVIFQKLRGNVYRFFFRGETKRRVSGSADDRIDTSTTTTIDSSTASSASPLRPPSASPASSSSPVPLVLKEFTVPIGAMETRQSEISILIRSCDEKAPLTDDPSTPFSRSHSPSFLQPATDPLLRAHEASLFPPPNLFSSHPVSSPIFAPSFYPRSSSSYSVPYSSVSCSTSRSSSAFAASCSSLYSAPYSSSVYSAPYSFPVHPASYSCASYRAPYSSSASYSVAPAYPAPHSAPTYPAPWSSSARQAPRSFPNCGAPHDQEPYRAQPSSVAPRPSSSPYPYSSPPSSSPPRSMEELFALTAGFSPTQSADHQKEKLRCFRSCFYDDDERFEGNSAANRCHSRSFPPAFDFISSLLRYFLFVSNTGKPFFTCQMIDATLATLVSPIVTDAVLVRRLSPTQMTPESVSYAALLMRGLEWIVVVNDICGFPFDPRVLQPSSFFDGKIFQEKFLKAKGGFSLLEICDGQADQASLVEQMRAFVIAGTDYSFLAPSFTFAAFSAKMASSNAASISAAPSKVTAPTPVADDRGLRHAALKTTDASRQTDSKQGLGRSTFRGSGVKSFVGAKDYMQHDDVHFFQGDGRLASAQRWNERGWGKQSCPAKPPPPHPRRAGSSSFPRGPRGVVGAAPKTKPTIGIGRGTVLKFSAVGTTGHRDVVDQREEANVIANEDDDDDDDDDGGQLDEAHDELVSSVECLSLLDSNRSA